MRTMMRAMMRRMRAMMRTMMRMRAILLDIKKTRARCNTQGIMTDPAPATLMDTNTDYLDEDTIVPNGQRLALVSFVGPEQRQKNDKLGMKIRGCFATQEEAAAHVKKLQAFDGSVDIFLLEVGKWALIPPDVDGIEDVEYQEKYLNTLMKDYKESQLKAKEVFKQRTEAVKSDGLDGHLADDERLPPPLETQPSTILKEIENDPASLAGPSSGP